MAEYVSYNGKNVKIGTCECLYYVSREKYLAVYEQGKLGGLDANLTPKGYLNVQYGFMFRFPFPDERKLDFGQILDPYREVLVNLSKQAVDEVMAPRVGQGSSQIGLRFQKPLYRQEDGKFILALVFRDGNGNGLYRIESDRDISLVVKDIVRNHVATELDPGQKKFYREIAASILKGYRMEDPRIKLQAGQKTNQNQGKAPQPAAYLQVRQLSKSSHRSIGPKSANTAGESNSEKNKNKRTPKRGKGL